MNAKSLKSVLKKFEFFHTRNMFINSQKGVIINCITSDRKDEHINDRSNVHEYTIYFCIKATDDEPVLKNPLWVLNDNVWLANITEHIDDDNMASTLKNFLTVFYKLPFVTPWPKTPHAFQLTSSLQGSPKDILDNTIQNCFWLTHGGTTRATYLSYSFEPIKFLPAFQVHKQIGTHDLF